MDALRKLVVLAAAALAAVVVAAAPVMAAEDAPADAPAEAPAEEAPATTDEGHRRQIAETPRDRLGLILLGAMLIAGGLGAVNARRQLRGERPQASGEFRWR